MAHGLERRTVCSVHSVGMPSERRAKIRADLEAIRRYLREWDPIGVIPAQMDYGLEPAEYDSYAGGIYSLLSGGSDVDRLAAHLMKIRTETMELPADSERDREIAQRIFEWWKAR
jgi:hypothetical protein